MTERIGKLPCLGFSGRRSKLSRHGRTDVECRFWAVVSTLQYNLFVSPIKLSSIFLRVIYNYIYITQKSERQAGIRYVSNKLLSKREEWNLSMYVTGVSSGHSLQVGPPMLLCSYRLCDASL